MSDTTGRLTVVGTGIFPLAHCSLAAKIAIETADVVFTQVPEPIAMVWLRQLNPDVTPLNDCYQRCPDRAAAYVAMGERILAAVRQGKNVCAVFYGHPAVFVEPSHEALRRARDEGFEAQMLPAISAEDCLFADVGLDPAASGCQSFEASQFLFWSRTWDPAAALILWQVGVVGDTSLRLNKPADGALAALRDKLLRVYPPSHRIALYLAAMAPLAQAQVDWLELSALADAQTTPFSTLYVPAYEEPVLDSRVLECLGLTVRDVLEGRKD